PQEDDEHRRPVHRNGRLGRQRVGDHRLEHGADGEPLRAVPDRHGAPRAAGPLHDRTARRQGAPDARRIADDRRDEGGDPMSALLAAALALAFSATTGPATPTVAGQTRTTNPQQPYVFSSHET